MQESCEVYHFFFLRHPFTSSIISITPLNFKSSGCAARGSCRRWKTKADSLLPFQSLLSINVLTKIGPLQIDGWRESKQRETGDSLVDWFLIYFWVEKKQASKPIMLFLSYFSYFASRSNTTFESENGLGESHVAQMRDNKLALLIKGYMAPSPK